jgi:hypothetical protein
MQKRKAVPDLFVIYNIGGLNRRNDGIFTGFNPDYKNTRRLK